MGRLVVGVILIIISISIFIWAYKERGSHINNRDKAEYIKIIVGAIFMFIVAIILISKGW